MPGKSPEVSLPVISKKALWLGAFFVWLGWGPLYAQPDQFSATIQSVVDGDTVILNDGQHLRLVGINTPELGKGGKPDQPLSRLAKKRLTDILHKTTEVRLEIGQERQDHYGRLLGHIRLNPEGYVQETLLEEGLAWAVAIYPNVRLLDRYRAAEARARYRSRGIWVLAAYEAIDADKLKHDHTGFQRIRGRVQSIGKGKTLVYLNVNKRFVITIPRDRWKLFEPYVDKITGKKFLARGWLRNINGQLRLRINHPFMLGLI